MRTTQGGASRAEALARRMMATLLVLSADGGAVAGAVPADWWSRAQRSLHDAEYDVSWQEHAGPVDLRAAYPTIRQPDRRRAFQLSPVSPTILFPQEASDAQPPAFRNDLDIRDVAEHLEVHAVFPGPEYQIGRAVKMSTKSDSGPVGACPSLGAQPP